MILQFLSTFNGVDISYYAKCKDRGNYIRNMKCKYKKRKNKDTLYPCIEQIIFENNYTCVEMNVEIDSEDGINKLSEDDTIDFFLKYDTRAINIKKNCKYDCIREVLKKQDLTFRDIAMAERNGLPY